MTCPCPLCAAERENARVSTNLARWLLLSVAVMGAVAFGILMAVVG